ncbi:Hydrophobin [Penicillium italicum]|uniref:Hydrophobin n=1 Tax=Penicillium italicum TaxID=40296 RepID=A0A0A2KTJ2_PENIT|nr:Hydrophobin [Penicillium italicum]
MRLSILSVLSIVGAGLVSALPQETNLSVKRGDTSECVGPLLCCGTLTTPLDPVVDPLLLALGIDAANIVGSIGLLCHGYEESSCTTKPQCCTEANLLGGTLALGCADLK